MPPGRKPRADRPAVAPGAVFHKLTVVREIPGLPGRPPVWWVCRCECGGEITVSRMILRAGGIRRCEACRRATPPDMTGMRFGRLVVLRTEARDAGRTRYAVCRCDCGTAETPPILVPSLLRRLTRSCGCLRRAAAAARFGEAVPATTQDSAARLERVVRLRAEGKTLQQIGDALGVTKERARQLLVAAVPGGRAARGKAPAADTRP